MVVAPDLTQSVFSQPIQETDKMSRTNATMAPAEIPPLELAARLINVCQDKDYTFGDLKYKLKLQRLDQPTVSGLNDLDYPSYQSLGLQDVNEFVPIRRNPFPQELTDQISRMECNCAMGLFTDVSRAWVTVDSDLFVWNCETNTDLAYYDAISNTILMLCLCKPKPNVLPSDIQFVLCVVTSVDIVLLGVNFLDTNGKTSNDYRWAEMNLLPEPLFKCPLDGAVVTDVCSAKNGRIFFVARDGCLYELDYQSRGLLFGKYCKKLNHSKGLMSYLAPSLITFTFGKDEPLSQIVYDESRHLLYTRSEFGSIIVFDLGDDGNQVVKAAVLSSSEIQHYAAQIAQTVEPSHFKPIVSISPISTEESISINIVGITHSGVRLYFSCHGNEPVGPSNIRPSTLRLVHVRFPPGFCPTSAVHRPDRVHIGIVRKETSILASAYDDQSDLLWCLCNANFPYKTEFVETQAQLPIRGRTWILNEIKCNVVKGQSDWLSTKGILQRPFSPTAVPHVQPPLVARQHTETAKRFLVLTPQGLHFIERLRPVDVLKQLLVEFGPDSNQIRSFFQIHQPSQGCAMCILLACSTSLQEREVGNRAVRALYLHGGEAKFFVSGAIDPYFDSAYTQRAGPTTSTPYPGFRPVQQRIYPELPPPRIDETCMIGGGPPGSNPADVNLSTVFTEGRPVGSTEVKFSDKHNGLYLYFSRILGPLWEMHLVTERTVNYMSKKSVVLLDSAFSSEEITWFVEQIRCFLELLKTESVIPAPVVLGRTDLASDGSTATGATNTGQRLLSFMRGEPTSSVAQTQQQMTRKRQAEAANIERQSLLCLKEIVQRSYEVLGLWKVLTDHQMHVVIGSLPKDLQDLVKIMRFNELVINGKELCADLISCLMSQYLSDRATTDAISCRLRQVCPSLFTSDDATSAKANELLITAHTSDDVDQRKTNMDQALTMYKRVASQINLPTVCKQLQAAHNFNGIVDLCLCAAKKFDPSDLGVQFYKRSDADTEDFVGQKQTYSNRMSCYKCMIDTMNDLLHVTTGRDPSIPQQQAQAWMDEMIKTALRSDDELCHVAIFDWMFDREISDRILLSKSPYVENYLQRRIKFASLTSSLRYLDLMWKYYEQSRSYLRAAELLLELSQTVSSLINLEQRMAYLARAVLCAKAVSDCSNTQAELLHDLEDKLEVSKLQMKILESLQQAQQPLPGRVREAIAKLNSELLDVTQLYVDYAEEFGLPECKLAIIQCAGHHDVTLIENLWREIVEKEFDLTARDGVDTRCKLIGTKISSLAKLYLLSPRFFPTNFLIKYLFEQSIENRFPTSWLADTLLSAGFPYGDLINTYEGFFKASLTPGPKDRKRQIYILQAISDVMTKFVQNFKSLSDKDRKKLANNCLMYTSRYVVELPPSGPESTLLRQKFNALQQDFTKIVENEFL